MACDHDSLQALESLMNEFFNNGTSNERKHEIENILSNFGQQNGSWRQCLYYLSHTTNHFVSMFCLTTIEQNVINKLWTGLQSEERTKIRMTLFQIVLTHRRTIPNFIRNKFVKLIVNIARLSWPHFYPDFLSSIMSLGQNPDTVALCIVFLQMTSEELISSRAELSYSRKIELKKLLLQEVPSILNVLTGFLEGIIEKVQLSETKTPPPSPTHGIQTLSPSNHGIGVDSFVSSMYHSLNSGKGDPNFGKVFMSLHPLDPQSESVASLCLSCLAQYFSWIPVSSLVQPQLLRAIFVFAASGAYPVQEKPNMTNLQNTVKFHHSPFSTSVLALSVVNEIFCKNGVSSDCEAFFVQTFKSAFHILHKLVLASGEMPNYLDSLESEYISKFTEFLRLIVSFHLKRFETKEQFAVLEFLSLLFRYTFLQRNVESYGCCLEIWSLFLEELNAEFCIEVSSKGQEAVLKYKEALITLARGIMQKIQLRFNQTELEELEHELRDDTSYLDDDSDSLVGDSPLNDSLTEWQDFLSNNLEILAKIADLFPDEVFDILYESFMETTKVYLEIQSNIVQDGSIRTLKVSFSQNGSSIHCSLRDLSSIMQAIGRLSILFLGDNLTKRSTMAMQVMTKLIEIANYGTAVKLFNVETDYVILHQDFIEVHAQVLSTLRAWTHWLSQLYGQQFVQVLQQANTNSPQTNGRATHVHQYEDTCHSLNKQLLLISAELLGFEAPILIVNCAIHLLSSLSILMRSPVALELAPIQELYRKVLTFPIEMKTGVCRALVNFLLLPWPSFVSDHKTEARKHNLVAFLRSLTSGFYTIRIVDGDKHVVPKEELIQMTEILTLIRIQIDELNGTDKNSRELYYQCIRDFIEHVLKVFAVFVNKPEICREILSLFVVIVQVLRSQIGSQKLVTFLQSLIGIFTDSVSVYLDLCDKDSNSVKALDRYLKLLELIVCETGSAFQRIIPNVISLCTEQMYPALKDKSSPELKERIFKIMHCLLDRNWKFFFKSSVQSSSSQSNSGWDTCDNEAQFVLVMQAYGQSFLESDINLFKMNLIALESLNNKYKLYHRNAFKNTMLVHFISALMQVLIQKSHDILSEEIGVAIYNMAAVDFHGFFSAFISQFVRQIEGLSEDQKTTLERNFKPETDLPSFTQNNLRFVNDLRFYRICNESVTRGSAAFSVY